jgi:hypothetical protein
LIYWSEFTWEAFATLFAGAGAVIAAFYVAKTQAAIQKELVGIQQVQAGLQSLSLRSELFDRRFQNYSVVRDFLGLVLREGREIQESEIAKFSDAHREARFLFESSVWDGLELAWRDCVEFLEIDHDLNQAMVQDGQAEQSLQEQRAEYWNRVFLRLKSLHELYHSLSLHI